MPSVASFAVKKDDVVHAQANDTIKRCVEMLVMKGGFVTPLADSPELNSLKMGCYSCPMFSICNGCKKTIKDLKEHNMVEDHCYHMKQLGPDILEANGLDMQMTPYVNESI